MEKLFNFNKKYLELLFDLVPSAIFVVDKERRIIAWNKKAEEITGYCAEDVLGKKCLIFTQEPCNEKCGLYSLDVEKPILAKKCTIRRKDGATRIVLKNCSLLKDEKGEAVGGIESFEDVTERTQMEERLRQARSELEIRVRVRTAELSRLNEDLRHEVAERRKALEALLLSETFLESVFSSIQDGISVLDKEMRIVRVNAAMERWYAHALPLVGKKCYEAYHSRSTQCDVCPTAKTLSTGKVAYEIVPKRGKDAELTGWLDLYSFPIFDKDTHELKGVIEYVRDITERRMAEEEREQLHKELLKSNNRLKQLALKDPHTGLYNHRYLQEVIEPEFDRAQRYAHPLTVIMLDIDYFKSINDVYGHQFGDLVLEQFAKQLKQMVRRYDIVIRFGGEEFVVLSPNISRIQALVLAQRLLDALNLCSFGNKEHTVRLKLSLALASYPEDGISKGVDLINLADRILNKAKEKGGNRVYSSLDLTKEKERISKGVHEADIKELKGKIDKLTKRSNQSLAESIFAFAKTIELKDHYTGEHVESTVQYATKIARALELSSEEIELVREAAILHDLGKIGVSENILHKKAGLTKQEFREIKKHPQIGADIIRPIQFLHNIIPFIFYHHERWDGKGYPSGIKGEEIPMGARIIALADAYQALTSDRPYRKAYPKKEALKMIKKASGTQFDPRIVNLFLSLLQKEEKKVPAKKNK